MKKNLHTAVYELQAFLHNEVISESQMSIVKCFQCKSLLHEDFVSLAFKHI